ncbi:MAG: anti-sigma factor antagonist [Limnochordaceae bacterium]|nr:anti-sigma factor antagonist [Limnochordaceae bacterium]
MEWVSTPAGPCLVAAISGELDLQTAPLLRTQIEGAWSQHPEARQLILDLSGVTFVDSSGLGAVLGRYRQCVLRGGRMALVGLQPNVRRLFELSGVLRIMEAYNSLDEALPLPREGGGRA